MPAQLVLVAWGPDGHRVHSKAPGEEEIAPLWVHSINGSSLVGLVGDPRRRLPPPGADTPMLEGTDFDIA